MTNPYVPLLIMSAAALVLAFGGLVASAILGPTKKSKTKADNYEITVERGFLYVKDQAEKPKTGDSSDLLLLLALMSMSGAGAAGTVYLYRRKREEQE